MAEPKRANKTAHRTFEDLEALVSGTVDAGAPDSGLSSYALTFRLLSHLSILDLRLEGTRPEDRTAAVERLQPIAGQGVAADGSALFSRLREYASDYAPTGAIATRESLFQALAGWPLVEAPSTPTAADTPRPRRKRAASAISPHTLWSRTDRLRPGARQPQLYDDILLVVDGHALHGFDARSGDPLWPPKAMGRNNQPPVDGTTVFISGMRNTLRPRDIRTGAETGPRLENCAAAQAECDRGTLYVPDLSGALHAYDTASGQHLWDWRPQPTSPGFLEAPRVVDDTVFVTWSGSGSWALQALNAETGQPRWRVPLRLRPPQQWLISDERVVTVAPEPGSRAARLATYDLHTGNLLWQQLTSDPVVGRLTSSGRSFHLAHPSGRVSSWDVVTGEPRWMVKVADSLRIGPVEADKHVLITSWDPGRLIALDDVNGSVAWQGAVRPTAALVTPAYLARGSAWAVSRAGVLQGWNLDTGRRLAGTHEGLLWDPDAQGMPRVHGNVLYVVTRNGGRQAISLGSAE
nr:PQQ-binding-like beta-propeller repeat protein [Streptomyces sp. SID9124]